MIGLIAIDIAYVVLISGVIGAISPRVPDRWLAADHGPLLLLPSESALAYRKRGVQTLIRRLPEWGEMFGGTSKATLPGTTPDDLAAYAIEARRAEWVHWLSVVAALALFAFNPWWLAAVLVLLVTIGNVPFILILRNNRLRIRDILTRNGRRS